MNTIKHLKEINGKAICVMDDLREKFPEKFNESGSMDYRWFEREIRPNFNIFVRHDVDSISFNMLTKPASEGGDLNRCQLVDLVKVGFEMLSYLNEKFPCMENEKSLEALNDFFHWQHERTENRKARNVEGINAL